MRVIQKPSATHFVLQCCKDPARTYERHITNMHTWHGTGPIVDMTASTGPDPPAAGTPTPVATTSKKKEITKAPFKTLSPSIGKMVFATDSNDSTECDLCKVTHATDASITLHRWGSQGKTPKTAVFKPVFIDKHGSVLLHKPRKTYQAEPFTWEIRTEDISALLKV